MRKFIVLVLALVCGLGLVGCGQKYVFVSVIRMGNCLQNDTYRASGDAVTGTVLEIVLKINS